MRISLLTRAAAAAIVLTALSSPARPDLVPFTNVQLTGQGIGSTLTVLTLQNGSPTTESGGVLFNGTPFGNASTGASQTSTFTFATLGITNANQLGLVVNLAEPGSESPPSVTTASSTLAANANLANAITLNVYSSSGVLLDQFSASTGLNLNQVGGGVGGSGIVFHLTDAEAAQLNAILAANAGTEVFTVGATFANAQGGNDVIQAVQLTTAIPEASTWAMMVLAFLGVGFMAYRQKGKVRSFRLI